MSEFWILKDKTPVKVNLAEWALWNDENWGKGKRIVNKTTIGIVMISTVFLGLDHSFGGDDYPIFFETMVFNGPFCGEMKRYTTWAEAEEGHQEFLKKLMNSMAPHN